MCTLNPITHLPLTVHQYFHLSISTTSEFKICLLNAFASLSLFPYDWLHLNNSLDREKPTHRHSLLFTLLFSSPSPSPSSSPSFRLPFSSLSEQVSRFTYICIVVMWKNNPHESRIAMTRHRRHRQIPCTTHATQITLPVI